MTDKEKVQQALAELWDVVKCRCNEAYTGRGLHDPDCECDSEGALQIVTGTINALTEQLTAAQHDAKEAEAYAEELERDMNLRKTVAPCDGHKTFAPEAYADFEIVSPVKIRALRERLAPALLEEDFELVDEVVIGRALRAAIAEINRLNKGENQNGK